MTMESLERAATSAMAEGELLHGYRGAYVHDEGVLLRRERCAFDGDVITAPADDWTAIAAAVHAHNLSTRHEHAARRRGLR